MCCLFGILDCEGALSPSQRTFLLSVLSRECEARGTDATGIAYISRGGMSIYKRPLPSHKMKLALPSDACFIMGHTRMTTQGSEKQNYNNHPFKGVAGSRAFALAHNGIIYNEHSLRLSRKLPITQIETDSYAAVQILEQNKSLSFDSLRNMAESVRGSFAFSIMDEEGGFTFVKGENPLCIYRYPKLGLYVYASTEDILHTAIVKSELKLGRWKRIVIRNGDIMKISNTGKRSYGAFTPTIESTCMYEWGYPYTETLSEDFYISELKSICGMYGVSDEEIDIMVESGFTAEEIERYLCEGEL